jgi:hypothetical protein
MINLGRDIPELKISVDEKNKTENCRNQCSPENTSCGIFTRPKYGVVNNQATQNRRNDEYTKQPNEFDFVYATRGKKIKLSQIEIWVTTK